MAKDDFLHPMIYVGPKPAKDMSHLYHGRALVFQAGPLSEQPGPLEGQKYCDVTEKEGRRLVKQFPQMFKWPEGTQLGPQAVSREEVEALEDRVEALEGQLAAALAKLAKATDAPKKAAEQKPKPKETTEAPKAPDAPPVTSPAAVPDAAD